MTELATTECAALVECEKVIERGLGTFVEVGRALLRVRDDRLYRGSYGSFEHYCRERWGFSRQTGYDLMQTAQVAQTVQDLGQRPPTREQARALAPVLREDPGQVGEAWGEVVELHGPKPTAAEVRRVARKRTAVVVGEQPGWAVRAEALAVELRNLTRSRPAERAEHAVTAAGLLADVQADLDRLMAGEVR